MWPALITRRHRELGAHIAAALAGWHPLPEVDRSSVRARFTPGRWEQRSDPRVDLLRASQRLQRQARQAFEPFVMTPGQLDAIRRLERYRIERLQKRAAAKLQSGRTNSADRYGKAILARTGSSAAVHQGGAWAARAFDNRKMRRARGAR